MADFVFFSKSVYRKKLPVFCVNMNWNLQYGIIVLKIEAECFQKAHAQLSNT